LGRRNELNFEGNGLGGGEILLDYSNRNGSNMVQIGIQITFIVGDKPT